MKRRTFLGATFSTAALASGVTGCTEKINKIDSAGKSDAGNAVNIGTIGGMTLEELRRQHEHDLFEEHIPFHDKYVVDNTYGSFIAATDHDGSHKNTDTSANYMGRGIWFYSFLYNNLAREDKYLDIAAKAVEFTMKHQPAGEDFWPGSYSREGKVIGNGKGGLPGDCYIAEGLAEYAKATGETKYMDIARETIFKTIRHYDRPDFKDGSTPYPGARNMWYWMLHMWFGITTLMNKPDAELQKIVDRCIDAIMNHHRNPKFDLMNNVINNDLSRSEDPKYSECAGCGHLTEFTWMTIYEAMRKKDRALFDLAVKHFKRHALVSYDDVYRGYYNDCSNVDENDWQLRKISWAQVFILINSLLVIEHTGAEWAKEMYADQNDYTQKKLTLKQHGYLGWFEPNDRWCTFVPHSGRKDNYHHPRHLMLNLLTINRMIERGGKVSGLFT